MIRYSILFLLFIHVLSCSQDNNLKGEKNIEDLASELYSVGDTYFFSQNFDSAIYYYRLALRDSSKIQGSELLSALLNDVGLSYKKMGIYDSAIKYYSYAKKVDFIRQDSAAIIGRLRNLGNVLKNQGRFSEALENYNLGLEYSLKKNDSVAISKFFIAIGNVYNGQNRTTLSTSNYRRALDLLRPLKDSVSISIVLNNLGNSYDYTGDYDSALVFFYESLKIKKKIAKDLKGSTFQNLGRVYFKKSEYDSSIIYLRKSYQEFNSMRDLKGKAVVSNELAFYYLQLGQLDESSIFLREAYDYAINQNNRTILMNSLKLLGQYNYMIGDLRQAYDYLDQWSAMRDSVFNQEKLKTLELQAAYELGQSEAEKKLAEEQVKSAQQRSGQVMWLALVLACFLFIVLSFMWYIYRQRTKVQKLNYELEEKNKQIATINKQNFHFTKNSLSEIVSMLNIQIKGLEAGQVRDTLIAEKLRMETTNILYKQLFFSPEDQQVELASFLLQIIRNTIDSILGETQEVSINDKVEKVYASQAFALNIGMITNEVCLNACKYALRNGGTFSIDFSRKGGEVHLELSDNGLGFDLSKTSESFGLKLINALSNELNAKLLLENTDQGVSYYFRIPLSS
ncbi:MAG: tetratricopeptide repeat protein [Ekhidna sp.]|nr:tetratricopeptide repeat protein [Ekhidna sp.]